MHTWKDSSVTVRPAVLADAGAIERITKQAFLSYQQSLPKGVDVPALNEDIDVVRRDIESKTVLVATQGETVMGSVRLYPVGENMMYFSRFGVSPDAQSGGIGAQIVTAAHYLSIGAGKDALVLHTCTRALALLKFYYANDFYVHDVHHDRGYARGTLVHELRENARVDTELLNQL